MTTRKTAVLEAVRELVPFIQAKGPEAEEARTLPADVLARLKDAGVLRMFVPRSRGGEELDLLQGMEVLETLSHADGSVGWTAMLGSESAQLLGLMPAKVFDDIYRAGPDVLMGGAFAPQGVAHVVPGGYRVTGRWSFATGIHHNDWLLATCVLLQDGKPLPGPFPGRPATRGMLLPKSQVRVVDNWSVLGLRGTGSHDFTVEDVFVSDDHTLDVFGGTASQSGPLFVMPVAQFALHMGAVAVGIAQGALDDVIAHAKTGKRRLYASATMAESPMFKHKLGRAETTLRMVRGALREESSQFWTVCQETPAAAFGWLPRIGSTLSWVAETTAEVVDACYMAMGGNAARDGVPLQRRFRDIHTFAQHGAAADSWYAELGGLLMGPPPGA